jgi:hypothetical protein
MAAGKFTHYETQQPRLAMVASQGQLRVGNLVPPVSYRHQSSLCAIDLPVMSLKTCALPDG